MEKDVVITLKNIPEEMLEKAWTEFIKYAEKEHTDEIERTENITLDGISETGAQILALAMSERYVQFMVMKAVKRREQVNQIFDLRTSA